MWPTADLSFYILYKFLPFQDHFSSSTVICVFLHNNSSDRFSLRGVRTSVDVWWSGSQAVRRGPREGGGVVGGAPWGRMSQSAAGWGFSVERQMCDIRGLKVELLHNVNGWLGIRFERKTSHFLNFVFYINILFTKKISLFIHCELKYLFVLSNTFCYFIYLFIYFFCTFFCFSVVKHIFVQVKFYYQYLYCIK